MDFNAIFAAYYNLYRAEAATPASTDDEYIVGLKLANEALSRWANYDNTYWKELFTTLVGAEDGGKTIVTGQSNYACPSDMKEPGGMVKILENDGSVIFNYKIYEPQDVQFLDTTAQYAYFTGSPATGFTLHFNTAPGTSLNGKEIQYVYYKTPTFYTQGSDISECPDPYFIVNRMLAMRYRVSRNPYYNTALRDAEDALKVMQMTNNSGSWADPWSVPDRSGTQWGA